MVVLVRKGKHSARSRQFGHICLLAGITVLILLPFLFMLLTSLKNSHEITGYPIIFFPARFRWRNYTGILFYPPFTFALLRTFGLAISTAFITCITSALGGYAFARLADRKNRRLFFAVIILLIVPYIVMQIPQFVLYARLKLVNTYWPWYLAAFGVTNPLYIFMYRQFFLGFPKELEEAAEVDGAGPLGIFFRIFLPNSRPAIVTIFIFAFNAVWGDYIQPAIFLNDPGKLLGTIMAGGWGPGYSPSFFAGTVIFVIPPLLLFLLVQKNIYKGMLFTGFR